MAYENNLYVFFDIAEEILNPWVQKFGGKFVDIYQFDWFWFKLLTEFHTNLFENYFLYI